MRPPALAALLLIAAFPAPAPASFDPNVTLTVYVHGFEQAGADREGFYGDTLHVAALDSIAALAGVPVGRSLQDLRPNSALAVEYYGDTPPPYFTSADAQEVAQITAQYGGGVPRYAVVVAKFLEHVLQTSGAQQVNVVSASFGSLITRWIIEKDVERLASRGLIARWLTAEGVLCGNWAASQAPYVSWIEAIAPLSIDVDHMHYDWIESHLHSPRTQADDPRYAAILVGQLASTDDSYLDGGLSALMAGAGEYQPNDGVQAVADQHFHEFTTRSMLLGRRPTLSYFPVDHYALSKNRGAWAQVATFLTQRRRVRVVMTQARVTNLREPQQPWWDWRPAEIVFQSRVTSPAVLARWGIAQGLSEVGKNGGVAPLRRYTQNGETQNVQQVVYDDFVLDEETQLRLDLHAEEIDYDARYGVYETTGPAYDDLGSGTLVVSTLAPGTYAFTSADWSCTVSVEVFEHPFAPLVGVADPPSAPAMRAIQVSPNPHRSRVLLSLPEAAAGVVGGGTLRVFDLGGRCVRSLALGAGQALAWDTRDEHGVLLPAGVYVYRVDLAGRTWTGRSSLVR